MPHFCEDFLTKKGILFVARFYPELLCAWKEGDFSEYLLLNETRGLDHFC